MKTPPSNIWQFLALLGVIGALTITTITAIGLLRHICPWSYYVEFIAGALLVNLWFISLVFHSSAFVVNENGIERRLLSMAWRTLKWADIDRIEVTRSFVEGSRSGKLFKIVPKNAAGLSFLGRQFFGIIEYFVTRPVTSATIYKYAQANQVPLKPKVS